MRLAVYEVAVCIGFALAAALLVAASVGLWRLASRFAKWLVL